MSKQQAKLRVRLYARLSKDDGEADKESNSISNQLQMLRYHSKENGFHVVGEYVDAGILIPRAYRAMKKGTLETSTGFKYPTDWVGRNVKTILENQVYLGHMVSHKTQTKSFKNKKLVAVPKEEWIVVVTWHLQIQTGKPLDFVAELMRETSKLFT